MNYKEMKKELEYYEIDGTIESFGFNFYENDYPEKQIEVIVQLNEDGLSAHCETEGVLYASELGGEIIDFLKEFSALDDNLLEKLREEQ